MNRQAWKPWHEVVTIRDDLRHGELAASMFAADLYDVVMDRAPPLYRLPKEFFALTYPTYNLRELAREVVGRLAGQSEKAVRQLALTYGGGKTHTLITLLHLVRDPDRLPDLPAVAEFRNHIQLPLPRARVAVLPFDKLDVEKGMEVIAPDGRARWLRHPWSVLAWQLAGEDGLRVLHAEGLAEERDSAPAEPLLVELLRAPAKEGLSTLVLLDEVLMYAREKVGRDASWLGRLANFFQGLTQAATKVERCAVVASLLASEPGRNDAQGREIIHAIETVFQREGEARVEPVVKEDIAEVLRRRFFKPESILDRAAFRPHAVAALKGIADLDESTRKESKAAEERLLQSYPFHPDLTEVFYAKWTQLERFQRTRGVLRTFAMALRDAVRWDTSPLIGAGAFLSAPESNALSEAARELTSVAEAEEYEGKTQEWRAILLGELAKAREIQQESGALKHREVEQAVFATFLHSQPIGQKAQTRDLLLLLGVTRPDRIELEKALVEWADRSWFLDENATAAQGETRRALPATWKLGSKPNLQQMLHDACRSQTVRDLVKTRLLTETQAVKRLTEGASAAGMRVHRLPDRPRDVEDDGEFHYVVLKPSAASDVGRPSEEAKRFLTQVSGEDRPRAYVNAVILVAPSSDGLRAAEKRVETLLGWERVKELLGDKDALRREAVDASIERERKAVPDAIEGAWCIVVARSRDNAIEAFKVAGGPESLFERIRKEKSARIEDSNLEVDALLPGGPYDLWKGDTSPRRVRDATRSFAQYPHLPRVLQSKVILDALVTGCRDGKVVLQARRPDKTLRTWWRTSPSDTDLADPTMEVSLPERATLSEVAPSLLSPGVLVSLWDAEVLSVAALKDYFSGDHSVSIPQEGYELSQPIPRAEWPVLEAAIRAAVREASLWLVSKDANFLGEEVPPGGLTDESVLRRPPLRLEPSSLLPSSLPGAWSGGVASASAMFAALGEKHGVSPPWRLVRDALDGALRTRLLERTPDSGPWPSDTANAENVRFRVPVPASTDPVPAGVVPYDSVGSRVSALAALASSESELPPNQLQDLADNIGEVKRVAVGHRLRVVVRVELGGDPRPPESVVQAVNELLSKINPGLALKSPT